jgi:hypothetical protein
VDLKELLGDNAYAGKTGAPFSFFLFFLIEKTFKLLFSLCVSCSQFQFTNICVKWTWSYISIFILFLGELDLFSFDSIMQFIYLLTNHIINQ